MSNKKIRKSGADNLTKDESGFTMIEAVIAIFILTIGLMGTAAAIIYALQFGAISRNVSSAKSIVVATIEEVEALRNARRLDFKQVANVGNVDNTGSPNPFNGFSNGLQSVSLSSGPDAVNGTDDDLRDPGIDGVFGTPDDFTNQGLARGGYMRQITIRDLSESLKRVEVRIQYLGSGGVTGEITGVSYLNNELRITR